jgi:hypothetical protein
MTDIVALRDFALDHPDKPYLNKAADEIEQLRMKIRALRQDDGAVIAQLQNDIREAEELVRLLRSALRIMWSNCLEIRADDPDKAEMVAFVLEKVDGYKYKTSNT